jgi:UDP-N-acetylmuramate--alanine ligase
MMDFEKIESIFFIGVGGIGMSALARYFIEGGFDVGGYDMTKTKLTAQLMAEGCHILYSDDPDEVPKEFKIKESTLIIYTPAIYPGNKLCNYYSDSGFNIYKRAEILGLITEKSNAIAVAGTHGKTSISTLTAHLLKQSSIDCSAFLGGISRNYNSNLITGSGDITVVEADEFDRSFHFLKPYIALITSLDADHLDVYGNIENMVEAYNIFTSKIRDGGILIVNGEIRERIKGPSNIPIYTYGLDAYSDFRIDRLRKEKGAYYFNLITPSGEIQDLVSMQPGELSLVNTIAAIALATQAGVSDAEIRKALLHFKGVNRRFDIRYNKGGLTYIDDYAHHPKELDCFINSVRGFYGERHITIVFQPHLFTRTRDHAKAFACSLDVADRVVLLPIYPAREEAIEGVSSQIVLDLMTGKDRILINKEDLVEHLSELDLDIILSVGAGDIDTLVRPIEKMLKGGSE